MNRLFLIPARGGSKGLPGKNIKPLHGKPLLHYSIELARKFSTDEYICLSTDDAFIINCAEHIKLEVPFARPAEISNDAASMNDVIKHALNHYKSKAKNIESIVLLQPTSPLRKEFHLKEALELYNEETDMVVSVTSSKANPYYNLFEEDKNGMLHISKGDGSITTRQSAPPVYQYNGAIYIINATSFEKAGELGKLKKIKKYVMDEKYSVDIDDENDWQHAERFLERENQ